MTRSIAILAALIIATATSPAMAGTPAQIFAQNCAACHQPGGQGIPGAFPALARSKFVTGDPAKVVHVLLNGRGGMPTFRDSLTDAEIAAVASYVRMSWGNKAPPVAPALVSAGRSAKTVGSKQRPIPAH